MSEVGDFDPFIRPRVGEIAAAREEAARRGGGEIGFDDFIDLINPLHHLPFVGPLYREITGDEIKPAAQILGGLIYGGPVGLVTSASQAVAKEATGKEITGHVVAALFGEDDETLAAAPQVEAAARAQVPIEQTAVEQAAGDAPLPEITPAAGVSAEAPPKTIATAEPEAMAAAEAPPLKPVNTTPDQPAAVLEGDAALRAFLRDRGTMLEEAAAPAAEEVAPQPAGGGGSDRVDSAVPAPAAEAAATVAPQRFMPVRPEHYSGRMAVRGPAGFEGDSAGAAASAITGETGAESPFAARMMEALKKYSALQEAPQTSAATLP